MGNSDETDRAKPKSSVQGENSVHRSRYTRDVQNKFEGKEITKNTANKPVTVSNQHNYNRFLLLVNKNNFV